MARIDASLDTICNQRKKQMLFTVAPPRIDILETSPYLQGYTQSQLDMRRKVEILKYAGNKQNTKSNALTKKELYSQTIRGRNRIELNTVVNNVVCPTDEIIYTPTSSSGIPGPVTYLYFDNNVPLYKYMKNTESAGITDTPIVDESKTIVVDNNTFFNDDEQNRLIMLNITEVVTLPRNTYNITVPIGFNVIGKKINNIDNVYDYKNISVALDPITPFEFVVKYNDIVVQTVEPIISYSSDVSNITSFSFDISNNADSFEASLYAGKLNISNITLFTEPGYVYDLYVKPRLGINIGNIDVTSTFNVEYNVSYGILMNISETILADVSNCVLLTEPSTQLYTSFSIDTM
jgi:hypothetical protein